ncbi:MAG: hypothetical protein ACP5NF_09690 [Thermoanaerobaculum sp.]
MGPRFPFAVVAAGLALGALPLPSGLGFLAVILVLVTLLLATSKAGENPKPHRHHPWLAGLVLLALFAGALGPFRSSPGGFFWLVFPCFLLAAPFFLALFEASIRKP